MSCWLWSPSTPTCPNLFRVQRRGSMPQINRSRTWRTSSTSNVSRGGRKQFYSPELKIKVIFSDQNVFLVICRHPGYHCKLSHFHLLQNHRVSFNQTWDKAFLVKRELKFILWKGHDSFLWEIIRKYIFISLNFSSPELLDQFIHIVHKESSLKGIHERSWYLISIIGKFDVKK